MKHYTQSVTGEDTTANLNVFDSCRRGDSPWSRSTEGSASTPKAKPGSSALSSSVGRFLKLVRVDDGNASPVTLKLGSVMSMALAQLANKLDATESELDWLSCKGCHAGARHYRHHVVIKRSGGWRTISSPRPRLREIQQRIASDILAEFQPHPAAMAFRQRFSIVSNAWRHARMAVIARIDLKDFFPSISLTRVAHLFSELGFPKDEAELLARLTTEQVFVEPSDAKFYSTRLPQGACTSPAIANLIAWRLDERLTVLTTDLGFVYTRYADDLTFSHPDPNANIDALFGEVRRIVRSEGFEVNQRKTRVMRPHQRQTVTGLTVNAEPSPEPRISRKDARQFRAFLHQCRTEGWDAVSERMGVDARLRALGYLSYVSMVNPAQADRLRKGMPPLGPEASSPER